MSSFDLLYGRDIYSLFFLRNDGFPIIYESHKPPLNSIHRWMESKLLKSHNFKRLVVISNALKRMYLEVFGWLTQERVVVAHDAAEDCVQELAQITPLPGRDKAIKVGYIGSLSLGRGIELILEIANRIPEVDFFVIGGSESEAQKYKSIASNTNIFFHSYVPPRAIPSYLSGFDILLAPYQNRVSLAGDKGDTSRWMSPLKIFEYMCCGKAIVASDLPVLREILAHNENCLLCQPDNVDRWAEAIKNLSKDENSRKALGARARGQFLERHTWHHRAMFVLNGLG
jgi:glycosyltransferase involved in cell wall biosynthesis